MAAMGWQECPIWQNCEHEHKRAMLEFQLNALIKDKENLIDELKKARIELKANFPKTKLKDIYKEIEINSEIRRKDKVIDDLRKNLDMERETNKDLMLKLENEKADFNKEYEIWKVDTTKKKDDIRLLDLQLERKLYYVQKLNDKITEAKTELINISQIYNYRVNRINENRIRPINKPEIIKTQTDDSMIHIEHPDKIREKLEAQEIIEPQKLSKFVKIKKILFKRRYNG